LFRAPFDASHCILRSRIRCLYDLGSTLSVSRGIRIMPPIRIIKSALIGMIYVLICAVAAFAFVRIAPWLDCRPLSDLPGEHIAVARIPAYARCYTVDHGQIDFSSHGTIADDARSFALTVAVFVIAMGLAVWPRLWNGLSAWARGPANSRPPRL
jgi:hypothetical protein